MHVWFLGVDRDQLGREETSRSPALSTLLTCESNQELLIAIIGPSLHSASQEHSPMLPDVISARERITSGHETSSHLRLPHCFAGYDVTQANVALIIAHHNAKQAERWQVCEV